MVASPPALKSQCSPSLGESATAHEATEETLARRRRTALRLHVAFLLVALAVLAAAATLRVNANGSVATPLGSGSNGLPALCMWQGLFGLECPGCGLTRCFVSAAHGQWAAAWRFHPVGLLMFAMVVAQIPYRGLQIARLMRGREEFSSHCWASWLAGLLGLLMIGQWVVRMVA